MSLNKDNIHIGIINIYIGGNAPASGAPPTWMTHTGGVPTTAGTWTHIGHTFEDTTYAYEPVVEDLESEQVMGIVDSYPTSQSVRLEFTAQERVYEILKAIFDAVGTINDANRFGFYFGGNYTVASQCVFFSSVRRDLSTKYEIGVIYKAQSVAGVQLPYSRKTPSRYKVVLRGVHDTSRNAADQLGQWFREK